MPAHRPTPPSALDIPDLAARIDRALPFTTVTDEPSPATIWCTDVIERAGGGGDPLAPWRRALARQQGSIDRPHIAAAFVLQWWCEVVAIPMAYAAELSPPTLASVGAGLGFELAPGLYPHRIVLGQDRPGTPHPTRPTLLDRADPERSAGIATGRAAYELLVSDVVRDFAPEVKMSSRQRWGVAQDVWTSTVRQAAGAAGRPTGPEQRRVSCCFIYALPGMRECSMCPRSAPGSPALLWSFGRGARDGGGSVLSPRTEN